MQLGDLDVNDLRKEAQPQLLTGISASIGPKAGGPASDGGAGIRVATIDNYQVRDARGVQCSCSKCHRESTRPG